MTFGEVRIKELVLSQFGDDEGRLKATVSL
jgi:hypothetical protein